MNPASDGEVEALREAHDNMIAWMSMNAPYCHMMTFRAYLDAATTETAKLRERVEELERERDDARGQAQALLLDAVAELSRANELAEIVEMFRSRIEQQGEWDDGCFYHNGTSASELQEPLRRARSALENSPATLADANSNQKDRSNV